MREVPISDEENRVILSDTFIDELTDLDAEEQRQTLKRLYALLDSSSPQHYIYETVKGCGELEVIRAGDYLRIYSRLVMGIPHGNKQYDVLFVFSVVKHDYRPATLERLDEAAEQQLEEVTSLDVVADVEDYLAENNAHTAEEVAERLER